MSGVLGYREVAAFFVGVSLASIAGADESNVGWATELPVLGISETAGPIQISLDYLVVSQASAPLFEVVARDLGMRLDLSDSVGSILSHARLSGTRDEIMDSATAKLGLDWFAFNGVLYVSDRSEALTRIVRLGDLKAEKVMRVLTESSLPVGKLEMELASDGAALAISGPPKLLALAEVMIEGIPPEPVRRSAESETRIVTVRRGNDAERVRLP